MFAITYVPQEVEPVAEGMCAINLLGTQFKEARVGGRMGRGTRREKQRRKESPHKCIIRLIPTVLSRKLYNQTLKIIHRKMGKKRLYPQVPISHWTKIHSRVFILLYVGAAPTWTPDGVSCLWSEAVCMKSWELVQSGSWKTHRQISSGVEEVSAIMPHLLCTCKFITI